MQVGEKYLVRSTARNAKNNLLRGKEARIAHLDPNTISLRVFQNGAELKLAVPRELFGVNFELERSFVPPNKAYASPVAFITAYL